MRKKQRGSFNLEWTERRDGSEERIDNMRSLRVWREDWGTEGLKMGEMRRD